MIEEATIPHYSAVVCKLCRQPIPVPAIVTRLGVQDSENGQSDRAFNLRCRSCEGESLYRSSQIVDVEGEPKGRRVSKDSVHRHGPLSRAAHA
jgi:hypothetical protein